MAAKNIAGLDISKTSVKLVEYSPVKSEVVTIAYLALQESDWDNETEVFEKIKEWIRKNAQSTKLEVAVSVPACHSVIRRIPIPSNESQIEKLISWELEQYLNSPLDDYCYDFEQQVDMGQDGNSVYTVAAFKKEQLDKFRGAFSSKGFTIRAVDIDIFAAYNTLEKNFPEDSKRSALLVKIDKAGIDLLLVEKNQWTGYSFVPLGEDKERVEGSALEKVLEEVENSYKELVSNAVFGAPKKVFGCGDLVNDDGLFSQIKNKINLKWTVLYSFQNVKFPFEDSQRQQIEETAPQCASALGLALQTAELEL